MERGLILYRALGGRASLKRCVTAVPILALGVTAIYLLATSNNVKKSKTEKNDHDENIKTKNSPRIKKGLPPGLINLGNTCFINCLLQGLASLSGFCQWMNALKKDDQESMLQNSLQDMLEVLTNKAKTECDVFTVSEIVECLQAHGWIITSEQQDTHEFFQILLSTLDEEMAHNIREEEQYKFKTDSSIAEKTSIIGKVAEYFPAKSLEMQSPFKGMLANRMKCTKCNHKSVRFDPFESVSLRIPQLSALTGATLELCLADFAKSEKVDGVECPKCTSMADSGIAIKASLKKQLSFSKLPNCLCIHIQRSYFMADGTAYKNDQFVRFTDILDLQPYRYNTVAYNHDIATANTISMPLRGGNSLHTEKQPAISKSLYRLKSVIVHIGDVSDGHFVTYRRAIGSEDSWLFASDEHIKTATKKSVLSNTAYLLFYERINDT
eukprot:gene14347-15843_t